MQTAIILGASSGVGRALAEKLAKDGRDLVLCSRSKRDLEANAADVMLKYGIDAQVLAVDINVKAERDELVSYILKKKNINSIFITIGDVIDQDDGLQSHLEIDHLVNSNFLSITHFLSALIHSSDKGEKLNIVLLSSITVGRPRKSNLVYATSKMAIDFYCRGLQHLLAGSSVRIIIFRLGYIDTAMSYGKKLLLPPVLSSLAAEKIIAKLNKRKQIHYYPGYWRYIIILVKLIPWVIYKKLSF